MMFIVTTQIGRYPIIYAPEVSQEMESQTKSQFGLKSLLLVITGVSIWLGVLQLDSEESSQILSVVTLLTVLTATARCKCSYPAIRPFCFAFAVVGWIGLFLATVTDIELFPSIWAKGYLTATMALAIAAGSLAYLLHAAYLKYRRR